MKVVAGTQPRLRGALPPARVVLLLAGLLALCACSSDGGRRPTPVRKTQPPAAELVDSAPPPGMDLSDIPEPVPHDEPRSRYGNHSPYVVYGKRYQVLPESRGYVARGIASWYGTKFHGRLTSNREPYDMYGYSAAHKTLPLPSYARVTNLENGRSAIVRINDRGPFVGDRLIDLSYVAAVKLGVHLKGTAQVEVRVIDTATPSLSIPVAAPPPPMPSSAATPLSPTPVLVSPPSTRAPPLPSAGAEPQPATRFFQQCGAFGELDNARMLEARLRGAGIAPVAVIRDSSAAPHRVVVGPYADRIAALAAEADLASRGFPGCHVLLR